jgi:hypothetical protein
MAAIPRYNPDGTLSVEKDTAVWQVQVLDDEATARRGYQVYRILAILDWWHAEYEVGELRKAGRLARVMHA